jgi:hypothetical protein
MFRTTTLLAATCVAALLSAPARAHDDGRLHVHVNGAATGPALHFDAVPSAVWGVASLAVAATLLRKKKAAPARARARERA